MSTLNAKFINTKLKEGWCATDFVKDLKMADEEEFFQALGKNFSNRRAISAWKTQLKKNSKKRTPSCKVKEDYSSNNDNNDCTDSKFSRLDKLSNESAELRQVIFEGEISHNSLIEKRKALVSSLNKKKQQMINMKKLIDHQKEEIEKILSEFENISNNISASNADLLAKKKKLEQIQAEIFSLQKVVIYAYDNGELEVENWDAKIPFSEEIYKEFLAEDSLIGDLTIKQIKQIVNIICLIELLQSQKLQYEVMFDNLAVQKAFNALSSKK